MLIVIATIFGLLVNSHEIIEFLTKRDYYNPIPLMPESSSDEYHYYIILNDFHNFLIKKREFPDSPFILLSIFPYLLSTIFYTPFALAFNRRVAYLFLRICLNALLFVSVLTFLNSIDTQIDLLQKFEICLLNFLMLPIFTKYFNASLVLNFLNKNHLKRMGTVNDFQRAIIMNAAAPIFYFSSSLLLVNNYSYDLIKAIAIIILTFSYLPLAIVYYVLLTGIAIFNSNMSIILLFAIVAFLSFFSYFRIAKKYYVFNQTYVHNDAGILFNLSIRNLIYIISSVIVNCYFCYFLYIYKLDANLIILYGLSSIFVITFIFYKHQINRMYVRGSTYLQQLIFLYILYRQFPDGLHYLSIILILALLFFSIRTNDYLPIDKELKLLENFKSDKLIVSNSIKKLMYIQLFTSSRVLSRHYSVSNIDYQESIKNFILNLKYSKMSNEQIYNLMTLDITILEWNKNRMAKVPINYTSQAFEYQFYSFYKGFNGKLIDDSYIAHDDFTNKYLLKIKELLSEKLINNNVEII